MYKASFASLLIRMYLKLEILGNVIDHAENKDGKNISSC